MARIKIDLPEVFSFSTVLSVRITDLNYGDHVGNDQVLSFLHEARVRYLKYLGYTEFNLEGAGLIMADALLIFKTEMFFGEELLISVQPDECSRVGFDLIYKIEKRLENQLILTAMAKTNMVCYDYARKKIIRLPEPVKIKLFS